MSRYKIDYCHHDSVTAESRQENIRSKRMRYIDADKLHDEIYELTKFKRDPVTGDAVMRLSMKISEVLRQIDEQPSADVVEVVRCKDCMYNDRGWCGAQEYGTRYVEDNDYCSLGKREDNE